MRLCRQFCLSSKAIALAALLAASHTDAQDLTSKLRPIPLQASACVIYLLGNVSHPDVTPGAIIASPSRHEPNYFFVWLRDAALVTDVFVRIWNELPTGRIKAWFTDYLEAQVKFIRKLQVTPNMSSPGLGEPKFHVNGDAIDEHWGRPQSDGQATLAITYIKLEALLEQLGTHEELRRKLYNPDPFSPSLLREALEYTASEWNKPSFDVWEEELGIHFYHLKVQHAALAMGAKLTAKHGDYISASRYKRNADEIRSQLLTQFWDPQRRVLAPTSVHSGGLDYKRSGIDSVVVLGINHTLAELNDDQVFGPDHEYVLSTVYEQEKIFAALYPVNQKGFKAVAIGRYPEDRYDGYHIYGSGNPWVLTTAGFGELYFRAALAWRSKSSVAIKEYSRSFFESLVGYPVQIGEYGAHTQLFRDCVLAAYKKGEAFLERTILHSGHRGYFAEQIWKEHGDMVGAADLTWSYAAFLTAYWQYLELGRQIGALGSDRLEDVASLLVANWPNR